MELCSNYEGQRQIEESTVRFGRAALFLFGAVGFMAAQSGGSSGSHRHDEVHKPGSIKTQGVSKHHSASGQSGSAVRARGNPSLSHQLDTQERETNKLVAQTGKKPANPGPVNYADHPTQKSRGMDFSYHHPTSPSATGRSSHGSTAMRSPSHQTNSAVH